MRSASCQPTDEDDARPASRPDGTPAPADAVAAPRHMLDNLKQGLCAFDGTHRLVLFNRRYAEIYDLAPGDLRIGMTLRDVGDLRLAAGAAPAMGADEYLRWRDRIAVENRAVGTLVPLRNGRVVEVHHEPTPDGGWVSTHDDVTERLEEQEALRGKTAMLDAALGAMDQGLLIIDRQDVLQVCNGRAMALLDLPAEMMRSRPTMDEVRRFQRERGEFVRSEAGQRRGLEETRFAEGPLDYERERPNGTILEVRAVALPDGGIVQTLTDVTARKRAEMRIAESEARLRALTDALPQMVWVVRASDSVAVYTNHRFRDYVGEIGPTRSDRIANLHPEDRARSRREWATAERNGRTFEIEERWRRHDGAYRWHKTILAPVMHQGTVVEWLGTSLDIDDILKAREALRASEARLALAIDAGSDGLWDCDLATGAAWFSDRAQAMLGYRPGELEGHARVWRNLLHPEDKVAAFRLLAEHFDGRSAHYECEHRLRRKDGSWGWVLARGKAVRDAAGRPLRIVGTHIDIAARKAAEGQIAHMARHDGLTGLPNRTLFRERLDQRVAEIRRYGGSCAVLCLDLDRFKAVNDTLGHLAGDALLREVAQRLRRALRAEDTVARLGGDEFAVLLVGWSGPAIAGLADRLIAIVQEPVACGDQQVDVGLSIGIALAPGHGQDGETVLRRADLALYRAKAEGRGMHRFFEPAMDEAAAERRRLELDLRRALKRGELALHYQPQVRSATGEIVGFEALVRWHHPTQGLVMPAAFIPLAEETGLIVPLGEWVLRAACREAARWTKPLKVAVNLSPRQFQQADLPETVLGILAETGLAPQRLEIEITESVLINDMTRAVGILRRLKSLGVQIAMDDFGTGYSSLATLQAFPFDKIKIDRSFVGNVEQNPQAALIVRAVLGLGRSLGMGVVAEGVETERQMRFLVDEDCDEVQGYLLGRPQPIERFGSAVHGGDAGDGAERDAPAPRSGRRRGAA